MRLRKFVQQSKHTRTDSPSVHPRPYVRRCYGFLSG